MKTKNLLLTLILSLMFVSFTNAQWIPGQNAKQDSRNGYTYFAAAMDSVGQTYATLTSNAFSLKEWDAYGVDWSLKLTSAAGSPKVTVVLIGSDYAATTSGMVTIDTLVTASTAETEQGGTIDFSTYGCKKYYALKFVAGVAGRADQTFVAFIKPRGKG